MVADKKVKDFVVAMTAGFVGAWLANAAFTETVSAGWGALTLAGFAAGFVAARLVTKWLDARRAK